jgi:hypothetical protein
MTITTISTTNDHQTITQQDQSTHHHDQNDPSADPQFPTQPKQQRQSTPVHQDPMVCSACPDGPAMKIHTFRFVDLALAVAASC